MSRPSVPVDKIQCFEDFFRLFEEKPGEYKYQDQINDIFSKGGNTLVIFYEDLLAYDPKIAELLRKNPVALIEDAIVAFKNMLKFQAGKLIEQDYFIRIKTKDEKSPLFIALRGLRAKNIDNLVWTKGILVRSSTIRPKLIKAEFEYMSCGVHFKYYNSFLKLDGLNFVLTQGAKPNLNQIFA